MTLTATPHRDRYRVIHIDDEAEQLFFAKTFLEKADPHLDIITVKSSSELFEVLDDGIDCVVSDYIMPDMNGIDLCVKTQETM